MPVLKTVVSDADARRLLDGRWGDVVGFTRLRGGESTQAFAVTTASDRLVLRVNRRFTYEKDAMLTRRYDSAALPIPAVLGTGTAGELHWAVSRAAPGHALCELAPDRVRRMVPDLVRILGTVHAADVSGTSGFGSFDHHGIGQFVSWRSHIANHAALVDWEHFHAIAPVHIGRLVRDACDQVDRLVGICPEHRILNHGDISLDNLFGEGDRITAVIDWSDARYGDPLWDVARTDFWHPELEIAEAYERAWGGRPEVAGLTAERILCYQLLIAANAVGFFVHTGEADKLGALPERTRVLVGRAAAVETRSAALVGGGSVSN